MENYVGEIRMFAGNFAPVDWAFCNGQALSISQYATLYALIGTTYGGDGVNTFNVPNLQSRIPIGQGQGTGLTPRVLGMPGGEEQHALIAGEMAVHNHPAVASQAKATTITAGNGVIYGTVTPNGDTYGLYFGPSLNPPGTPELMSTNAVANTGANLPHDNTMPSLTFNFIIALVGIYPTQS